MGRNALIARVTPRLWLVFPEETGIRREYHFSRETKEMGFVEGESLVKKVLDIC